MSEESDDFAGRSTSLNDEGVDQIRDSLPKAYKISRPLLQQEIERIWGWYVILTDVPCKDQVSPSEVKDRLDRVSRKARALLRELDGMPSSGYTAMIMAAAVLEGDKPVHEPPPGLGGWLSPIGNARVNQAFRTLSGIALWAERGKGFVPKIRSGPKTGVLNWFVEQLARTYFDLTKTEPDRAHLHDFVDAVAAVVDPSLGLSQIDDAIDRVLAGRQTGNSP